MVTLVIFAVLMALVWTILEAEDRFVFEQIDVTAQWEAQQIIEKGSR